MTSAFRSLRLPEGASTTKEEMLSIVIEQGILYLMAQIDDLDAQPIMNMETVDAPVIQYLKQK